ncbi:MAG: hypothetical protein ABI844_09130 [Saprospiraceae bacterium]
MLISGFSFVRNADKLYYPLKESILSIIDFVDEFILVYCEGDKGDQTLNILNSITNPKLKIITATWDIHHFPNGTIYAHLTDLAKSHCSGKWCFYLQADEVIHENDLLKIMGICKKYRSNDRVEGIVFNYLHFYGNYNHYFSNHTWYRREIRIIKNHPDIHSWRDAQSFRFIPNFKDNDYYRTTNTRKLYCVLLDATVYHYGWVRPPALMHRKRDSTEQIYHGDSIVNEDSYFDYGRLDKANMFTGTHPMVMNKKIPKLDWQDQLRYSGPVSLNRPLMKHEKWKYKIISFLEEQLFYGKTIGGYKNYHLLNPSSLTEDIE